MVALKYPIDPKNLNVHRLKPEQETVPQPEHDPADTGIPFMITGAMKLQLELLGFSAEQISNMTPEQAYEHINSAPDAMGAASKPKRKTGISLTPFVPRDSKDIPPRDWVYGLKLIRKFLTLTVAPSGIGKSSKSLVEVLAMVTGRDLLGIDFKSEPLRVWYWCGEDPLVEIERRIRAIMMHYSIKTKELGGRLFINSGRDMKIKIATEDKNGFKIAIPLADELADEFESNKIDVAIIDPFVSSHSVSENDNNRIDEVAKLWCQIADVTDMAIEVIHHVRKGAYGQHETTVDDGRGASALLAASRVADVLNVMSEKEAADLGIEPNRRRFYFRCDNGKASMSPPAEKADWYQLASVDLGNATDTCKSDNVGVVTAWTPPKTFDDVTYKHLEEVARRVEAVEEGNEYRDSSQSPDWIGNMVAEVIGLDIGLATTKANAVSSPKCNKSA